MRVKVINKRPASVLQKKRVCAYARVSTDSRRQEDSLENQMETYGRLITGNPEYEFINAECCQHLLRDLKKVEMNLPNRVWCKEMIQLFQEYDHKRKELMDNGIEKSKIQ